MWHPTLLGQGGHTSVGCSLSQRSLSVLDSLGPLDGPATATAPAGESLLSGVTATGWTGAGDSRGAGQPCQLLPVGQLGRVACLRPPMEERAPPMQSDHRHSHLPPQPQPRAPPPPTTRNSTQGEECDLRKNLCNPRPKFGAARAHLAYRCAVAIHASAWLTPTPQSSEERAAKECNLWRDRSKGRAAKV